MKDTERKARHYCLFFRLEVMKALSRVRINCTTLFNEGGFQTYFEERKKKILRGIHDE